MSFQNDYRVNDNKLFLVSSLSNENEEDEDESRKNMKESSLCRKKKGKTVCARHYKRAEGEIRNSLPSLLSDELCEMRS